MSELKKVTIYRAGEFLGNIIKTEARLVDHGRRKYAQYNNAPFVRFIPKRKRKECGFVKGFKPYFIILEGWGHPDPDGAWGEIDNSGALPMQQAKYSAFDEGWVRDFEQKLGEYLKSDDVKVVADYRYTTETCNA